MQSFSQPAPTVKQMSGLDPDGRQILSVLAKRTYRLDGNGRAVLDDEQLPLVLEPIEDPACPELLAKDIDVYPYKVCTDVVLHGNVHPSQVSRTLTAEVRVGAASKSILAIGNRTCSLSPTGRVIFSEPAPLEPIPLRYTHAYGGRDAVAEAKNGDPYAKVRAFIPDHVDLAKASPFNYPRNPCGVGYLLEATQEAVARLKLPNLEDPLDRLSPDRLLVGKVERWSLMPLPQATDWLHHFWFPRLAFFGYYPEHESNGTPITEVARGLIPPQIMLHGRESEMHHMRFTNGASLGLQLPYLAGNEECVLTNIVPHRPRYVFRLPNDRPKIWTDGRNGKLNPTESVIHTIVIEPEQARLSIVWRGCALALRPYLPEELETMPLKVEWA